MDLEETGWGGVEWIHVAQDMDCWRALVNAVMNFRVLAPRSQLVLDFLSVSANKCWDVLKSTITAAWLQHQHQQSHLRFVPSSICRENSHIMTIANIRIYALGMPLNLSKLQGKTMCKQTRKAA
jgi:hypothetical protein